MMADDDLPERLGFFIVTKGFYDLIEWKHTINYCFQAVDDNRSIHGDELSPIARKK
jgi:hypothetical protein